MRNILIPAIFILVGLGAGAGAGLLLRPTPETGEEGSLPEETTTSSKQHDAEQLSAASHEETDFVKLPNQFVVPIVRSGAVSSLVVMSLSFEVVIGNSEAVLIREPKLRDQILRLLFDYANSGGFDGTFTDAAGLSVLKGELLDVARQVLGPIVLDVLITEIMRQDS